MEAGRPAWHARAACRDVEPTIFFPPDHSPARRAKALCDGCPVRQQCLDYALPDASIKGVWGGTSERERTRMRRRLRLAG